MLTAVVNAKVVLKDRLIKDGVILFENGIIDYAGEKQGIDLDGANLIDAGGLIAGPGFVDTHCHAGGKHWAHENPVKMAEHHLAGGTTSLLCTLYHNIGIDGALSGGKKIITAIKEGTPGNITGIHFEGPFLNKKYGADHNKARLPDPKEYNKYLEQFGKYIKSWTVAPEVEGTDAFIDAVLAQGIPLALGHSEASPERVYEVAKKGARICTHLLNATGSSISPTRYGGTFEVSFDHAVMLCDGIYCEIINDSLGAHVRPDMSKLVVKTIGVDRIIGLTDACTGDESDSDLNIENGQLYGSKLKMINVARNFKNNTGLDTVDIFKVCAKNPAEATRQADVGTLEKGKLANIVFVTPEMELKGVILKGEKVI